jgi:hypothetical protein
MQYPTKYNTLISLFLQSLKTRIYELRIRKFPQTMKSGILEHMYFHSTCILSICLMMNHLPQLQGMINVEETLKTTRSGNPNHPRSIFQSSRTRRASFSSITILTSRGSDFRILHFCRC